MPLVEINEEDVQAKLAIGPVGIGEDHSKTRAREFLCRIINLNIVKVLFLEIPGDQGKSFDTCLAKALSMRASGNGKGSIDFAQKELNPIDARLAQNPIKFSELIGLAWKHDVRVVFSDKFYSRPGQAASEAGMKTRNEFVDKVFEEAAFMCGNTTAAGCVILFGAEHFKPLNEGDSKIGDKMIDRTLHWVDLSE